MSQRSKNQEEVNAELYRLNEKYIPKYDIILNTSPPRVGKTINTILYHIKNNIPAIVFIDNEQQANDIKEDLKEINEKYSDSVYYWKSKKKLCYIFSNEDEIIEKEGLEFFETIEFKYKNNMGICKNCKYKESCRWRFQKIEIKMYPIVLMNKANIFTPLADTRNTIGKVDIFYYHDLDKYIDESIDYDVFDDDSRTIIYDEKLEEIHTINFRPLKDNDFKLLNKIIELKKPSIDITIHNDTDFINAVEKIRDIFINYPSITKLLEESGIDFTTFGKHDKKIYINIFLQKIRTNIQVYEYLNKKSHHLPYINGEYDWRFFTYDKLYIDALFERNEIIKKEDRNKIILLDATPLKPIVERLKSREGLKEINLDSEIFDKNSSILKIYREKHPSMASRNTIITRTLNKRVENNILQDKSYNLVLETKKYIEEFKRRKNIKLPISTKEKLNLLKNHGDTYNHVIKKLLTNTLTEENNMINKKLYILQKFMILQTRLNPQTKDNVNFPYAFAWKYDLYPLFHESEEWHENFKECFKIKEEKISYVIKLIFEEARRGGNYTFNDIMEVYNEIYGSLNKEELVTILEYCKLTDHSFPDGFWEKINEYPLPSEATLGIIQCERKDIIKDHYNNNYLK